MGSRTFQQLPKPIFFLLGKVAVSGYADDDDDDDWQMTPGSFNVKLIRRLDLITYCEREKVRYIAFENWSTILAATKEILSGTKTVQDIAQATNLQ